MRNLLHLLVVSVLIFGFVSCGEETSETSVRRQGNGTVLNRTLSVRPQKAFKMPMLQKEKLPPLNTQTWPMIATGQTKCYDNKTEVDCLNIPEGYGGQDGQTRYGTRSLNRKSSNEIVEDDVTQLLWTKKVQTDMTWYEAKVYCENLKLENKTWRLPTTAELRSIINYGKIAPALDKIFYDDANGSVLSDDAVDLKEKNNDWFWAAKYVHFDSDHDNKASSWIINFYDGFVEFTSRFNKYNVRCVTKNK